MGGSRGGRVRLDRCAGLSTFRTLAARRRQRRRPVASGSRAALPHRGLVGSALWRSVLRSPVELDRHLRGTGPMADPGCGGGRLLRGRRRAADSRPATAGGAALDRRCLGAHRSRAGPRTVRRLSVGAARVQPGRVAAAVVRRARRRSPRHVRGGDGRRRAGARNPGATARPAAPGEPAWPVSPSWSLFRCLAPSWPGRFGRHRTAPAAPRPSPSFRETCRTQAWNSTLAAAKFSTIT